MKTFLHCFLVAIKKYEALLLWHGFFFSLESYKFFFFFFFTSVIVHFSLTCFSVGNFPGGPLRHGASTADGLGSIPSWRTRILHANTGKNSFSGGLFSSFLLDSQQVFWIWKLMFSLLEKNLKIILLYIPTFD